MKTMTSSITRFFPPAGVAAVALATLGFPSSSEAAFERLRATVRQKVDVVKNAAHPKRVGEAILRGTTNAVDWMHSGSRQMGRSRTDYGEARRETEYYPARQQRPRTWNPPPPQPPLPARSGGTTVYRGQPESRPVPPPPPATGARENPAFRDWEQPKVTAPAAPAQRSEPAAPPARAERGGRSGPNVFEKLEEPDQRPVNPPAQDREPSGRAGSGTGGAPSSAASHAAPSQPASARTQKTPAAPAPVKRDDLPFGVPVVGKNGYVYSPYTKGQLVDVTGIPSGTRVECPYTKKHFRVP